MILFDSRRSDFSAKCCGRRVRLLSFHRVFKVMSGDITGRRTVNLVYDVCNALFNVNTTASAASLPTSIFHFIFEVMSEDTAYLGTRRNDFLAS